MYTFICEVQERPSVIIISLIFIKGVIQIFSLHNPALKEVYVP